jgi:c-di-GMP-related signal transduction protein
MNPFPYPAEMIADATSDDSETRYIARQPIFDAHRQVYGYELLFRSGNVTKFDGVDASAATISTIDMSMLIGPESITDGLPAFVNCTRELLLNGIVKALPRDGAVLEILESVAPDAEVLSACAELKKSGYRLAIDDFDGDVRREPLIELAEIIKVDFSLTKRSERSAIVDRYARRGHVLLAEKVETPEEFNAAVAAGYQYFQGFFFCRPTTIAAPDIRCLHPAYAALLSSVYDTTFDVDEIDRAIRQEPSLCYRLLRYLNSAAFGIYPVRSIKHAVILLGQRELQKWISIVTAIAVAGPRSSELIRVALRRARFLELVATKLRAQHPTEYFLAGTFSLIDAMLNRPMASVMASLPLSAEVKGALTGHENAFSAVLHLAVNCERGDWTGFAQNCAGLKIAETEAWGCYERAHRWVRALNTQLA